MSDRIEQYLDDLAERLHPYGVRVRRLLAETEDHLREAAEELQRTGVDSDAACEQAIVRFGPPDAIARSMRTSRSVLAADVLRGVWVLTGVGLVAIGLSGVVAYFMALAAGTGFLAGDGFGVAYTPERCSDFLSYFPSAANCMAAAALHHSDEIVTYRVAAGVLGLIVLGSYLWFARRRPDRAHVVPRGATAVVGATMFGLVGIALSLDAFGTWAGEAAHHETAAGVGDPLSAGVVALLAAFAAAFIGARQIMKSPAAR